MEERVSYREINDVWPPEILRYCVFERISFRNQWPMARVTDMFKEADGYSQTVKLLVGENKLKNNSS